METLNQNMVFQKFLLFGITGICLLLALHAVSSSVYGAESESDTIAILKILQRYEIDDTTIKVYFFFPLRHSDCIFCVGKTSIS